MTDPITSAAIAKLRELLAKSTPGPWREYRNALYSSVLSEHWCVTQSTESHAPCIPPDAALIVAMRNALPALLDAAEQLARIEGWHEAAKKNLEWEKQDNADLRAQIDAVTKALKDESDGCEAREETCNLLSDHLAGMTEDRDRNKMALLQEQRGHDVTRSDLNRTAAERDALKAEIAAALSYAKGLFKSLAPQCVPFDELGGVISQIDNATTVIKDLKAQLAAVKPVKLPQRWTCGQVSADGNAGWAIPIDNGVWIRADAMIAALTAAGCTAEGQV